MTCPATASLVPVSSCFARCACVTVHPSSALLEYIVDMLQAPAWQPPLPEEPPKVEPKTEQPGGGHVMSEYERFMAEVRSWSGQHCK